MRRLVIVLVLSLFGVGLRANAASYVGYVGCSQAINAVDGYHRVGGTKFWPVIGSYSGGTVQRWANEIGYGPRWKDFKTYLGLQPPGQIWVQWCSKSTENHALDIGAALKVLKEIRRLAPGVKIFTSAQNDYVRPHVCALTGPDGPVRMRLMSILLAAGLKAKLGPNVGSLRSKYGTPSVPAGDQTVSDGCHANLAGELNVLGPSLKKFFG